MLINRLYFSVKPFLPRRLSIGLRRLRARWILRRNGHSWPINPEAGRAPAGWRGWPGGSQFALVLTHDVEGPEGLERVKTLAWMEMKLGFRSSFNLIPEGPYHVPRDLRDFLTQNGFEVGVHDLHHDGRLYSSRAGFRRKAARINDYLRSWNAVGFRSGFMLHNLDWLGDLDIAYDASTFDTDPFEPQPDGVDTIFPFWVPHRRASAGTGPVAQHGVGEVSGGGYVELPYTLPQDITLFAVLQEKTTDIWKRKLHWVAERGGMGLLNLHPDYMNFSSRPSTYQEFPAALYDEFLGYIRHTYGGQVWAALPRELAAWWKAGGQYLGCSAAVVA